MATLLNPFLRADDANGNSVSGAQLAVFEAGTTTPVTTYSDRALTTAQAQPLIANSAGEFAQSFVASGIYKIRVSDADGVTLYENDNVRIADRPDDPVFFDTAADLLASENTYVEGTFVIALRENRVYEAAASGATDHEVTNAGGQKFYVRPTKYDTVAELIASTEDSRFEGAIWEAGGFRYEEAASGASDQHVTTAGGVKLYVVPLGGRFYLSQWGAETGEVETATGNAFLEYLGANGGTGVWDVSCRGAFRLNSPATGFDLIIQKSIEASSISNVLQVVDGQDIRIWGIGDGIIDCRATALGASSVAQIYHGLVLVNCQRCRVFMLPTRDQNGTGILSFHNSGLAGSAPSDIQYHACSSDGVDTTREDTNGLVIADCEDAAILDCHAKNVVSFGLEFKNETSGTITGYAENCGFGVGLGQQGATAPGVGGCRDVNVRAKVKDCVQCFVAGFTLGGRVDLVVDQRGTLISTGDTPAGVRLASTVGLDIKLSYIGSRNAIDLRSGAESNTIFATKIDSSSSTWVATSSGADNNNITIDQAGNSIGTGTFIPYSSSTGKISNLGSNNSIVYLRAEKRVQTRDIVTGFASGLSVLGATSTSSQLAFTGESIPANNFIEGTSLEVVIQGRIDGPGTKTLSLQFGTTQLVAISTTVATAEPFFAKFVITATGSAAQRNTAIWEINGESLILIDAATTVSSAGPLEPRLFARAFDASGEIYLDSVLLREIGCRS